MPRNQMLRKTMRALRAALHAEITGMSDRELRSELDRAEERVELSRRDVLKMSLQATALLPFSGLLTREVLGANRVARAKSQSSASDPVIIVGAGVAGLVAAYRLSKAGIPVELYEGGSRVGGRVFTKDRFNADGMFCELGGELIDTGHKEVLQLCRELGLPIEDLRRFDKGVEHDIFHFAGKVRTQRELIPAFRPLARHLARDIKAVFPQGNVHMVTHEDHRISRKDALHFDNMSLREYLYSKTDVERWVLQAIEVLYVCEYGLDSDQQSALNLLILIDPAQTPDNFDLLGESDECLRVRGGNSRLVEALETRIRERQPGAIRLRHKLMRVDDRVGKVELTFAADGGRKIVRTARAVLGLPFATLRGVEGVHELGLSPLKLKCIQELGYGKNTKFMTGYHERYWRKAGSKAPASRANIVTDAIDQSFWETSKGQTGKSGIITNYLGGSRALDRRAISDRLSSVLAELDSLYPGLKAGYDGNAAFFDWGNYELNLGSYVCPHPGQYTTLWGAAAAPELDGRLFFTGEHTSSDGAGFINGAVQSGNQVVAQMHGTAVAQYRSGTNFLPLSLA